MSDGDESDGNVSPPEAEGSDNGDTPDAGLSDPETPSPPKRRRTLAGSRGRYFIPVGRPRAPARRPQSATEPAGPVGTSPLPPDAKETEKQATPERFMASLQKKKPRKRPGTTPKAQELLLKLYDDLMTVNRWHDAQPKAETNPREHLNVLWTRFTSEVSQEIRSMKPTRDTTLQDILSRLRSDPSTAHEHKRPELCGRQCHYVGAATEDNCRNVPGSIVSWCAPHPTGGVSECAITLCFDTDELDQQLRDFRRARTKDAGVRMKNPAYQSNFQHRNQLSGQDPPARDARDGSCMFEYLDENTVVMLEWQVRFAREQVALLETKVSSEERGLLFGVVLPTMYAKLQSSTVGKLLGNVWRKYTPDRLKRVLRWASNKLLYILENPFLNAFALMLTKCLRMVCCLLLFGIDDREWDAFKETLLGVADPGRHLPILSYLFDIGKSLLSCFSGLLSGQLFNCAGQGFSAILLSVRFLGHFGTDVLSGVFQVFGGPLNMISNACAQMLST